LRRKSQKLFKYEQVAALYAHQKPVYVSGVPLRDASGQPVLPAAILAHLRAAIRNGKGVLKRNVDNFLAAEVNLHSRSARSRLPC